MVLALALAFIFGAVEPEEQTNVLLGGAIIGVVPTFLGAYLFDKGMRRMDASRSGPARRAGGA
jgi:drug/metabolite transporter (DMT)-like permease